MIQLKDIYKEYTIGDDKFAALSDINLEIKEGELVGILGSSGSGKSTLMHILGLLDTPTRGQVILDKQDVAKLSDDRISTLRNRYMGFVFQQFNLINDLSVLENVVLPSIYAKQKINFDVKEYATELLDMFGISNRKNFFPNKISGGQQQRVAIARALVMKPKIIFADEPTGNLDTKTGDDILKLLEKLNKDLGITVIIVTHEKDVADRTKKKIYIRDGTLVSKYL